MADYATDFEDYDLGDTDLVPNGWTPNDEGVQEVVSSPARDTRAVALGTVEGVGGSIERDITIAETGLDITYWAYRHTPDESSINGPALWVRDSSSPFWTFQIDFTLDGGQWYVLIASDEGTPSTIRAQALFTPPEEEWFKVRVRAEKASSGGSNGRVIVAINDVELLDEDDIPMPSVFDTLFFVGVGSLVDDIGLVDGFDDDPEPLTCVALNLGAVGSLTVKAHRAIATSVDGGDHVHDEPNTWIHWGAFKVVGDVDLPGLVVALPKIIHPLGGSRNAALQHNAVVDAYDYLDAEIDGDDATAANARVEVRVGNSGISVTPQIYNVTTASVAVTGSSCSATNADYTGTNQQQTLNFTPAAGVNRYRLRLTPSANTHPVWGIGVLEEVR